jgi:hypothetical protein
LKRKKEMGPDEKEQSRTQDLFISDVIVEELLGVIGNVPPFFFFLNI